MFNRLTPTGILYLIIEGIQILNTEWGGDI